MKRIKKILCILIALSVLCTVEAPKASATSLSGITNESIQKKKNEISNSSNLKKQLQNNLTDAKAIKKQLEGLKSDISQYIKKIDTEIITIQTKIDELNGLIAEKEAEIEAIKIELAEAEATEKAQYEAMKERIKFMYEKGDTFYLELMLSAKSYGDFLTKADYIEKLSAYDREKLDEYTAQREWVELCKASLEAEKEALDTAKAAQEEEEASLQVLLTEKKQQLNSYDKQIASKNAEINDLEEDIAAQTEIIEALEAAILEEQKAIAAANGIKLTYDGGKFQWPCPAYIRVTDDFGWRTDPITGAKSYHSGIDLGAAAGSAILCAYDGQVVAADFHWSMGNYVMVNHGGGLYTIYMHASAIYVKSGDLVTKGEKIAAVGTTGRSTGNHLHFGVRLNGEYVSPWDYFK